MDAEPAASFGTLDLDEGLRELVKPELAPGERLLWAGRSSKRLALGGFLAYQAAIAAAMGLVVISVTGFLLGTWFDARFRSSDGLVISLSVLSGFAGALILVATGVSWITKAGEARRETGRSYALTDRRAILWTPGRSPSAIDVNSVPFTVIKVASLKRVQYPDGSGDLDFWFGFGVPKGFQDIPDVQRVEKILRDHLPRSAWKAEPVSEDDDQDCYY